MYQFCFSDPEIQSVMDESDGGDSEVDFSEAEQLSGDDNTAEVLSRIRAGECLETQVYSHPRTQKAGKG